MFGKASNPTRKTLHNRRRSLALPLGVFELFVPTRYYFVFVPKTRVYLLGLLICILLLSPYGKCLCISGIRVVDKSYFTISNLKCIYCLCTI